MRQIASLGTASAALALLLALASVARAADATVTMDGMAFAPAELSVPAGTNVIFQNTDHIAHQVISRQGDPFDLKLLKPGQQSSHVFVTAGSYVVQCDLHPKMKMTINVQ